VTKILRRGLAPEHSRGSARCAGGDVVAEGVAEVSLMGGRMIQQHDHRAAQMPQQLAEKDADFLLPDVIEVSKVDSTGPGVVVADLQKSRK